MEGTLSEMDASCRNGVDSDDWAEGSNDTTDSANYTARAPTIAADLHKTVPLQQQQTGRAAKHRKALKHTSTS